jgi:hypothetical protein
MSPHIKRDGRYLCVEVSSQELEELRQEPFKNDEYRYPLWRIHRWNRDKRRTTTIMISLSSSKSSDVVLMKWLKKNLSELSTMIYGN